MLPHDHPHFPRAHPGMEQQAAAGSTGGEQELMSSDFLSEYAIVLGPFSAPEKEPSAGRQKAWVRISHQLFCCCALG